MRRAWADGTETTSADGVRQMSAAVAGPRPHGDSDHPAAPAPDATPLTRSWYPLPRSARPRRCSGSVDGRPAGDRYGKFPDPPVQARRRRPQGRPLPCRTAHGKHALRTRQDRHRDHRAVRLHPGDRTLDGPRPAAVSTPGHTSVGGWLVRGNMRAGVIFQSWQHRFPKSSAPREQAPRPASRRRCNVTGRSHQTILRRDRNWWHADATRG